jgi:hypothetical protein
VKNGSANQKYDEGAAEVSQQGCGGNSRRPLRDKIGPWCLRLKGAQRFVFLATSSKVSCPVSRIFSPREDATPLLLQSFGQSGSFMKSAGYPAGSQLDVNCRLQFRRKQSAERTHPHHGVTCPQILCVFHYRTAC